MCRRRFQACTPAALGAEVQPLGAAVIAVNRHAVEGLAVKNSGARGQTIARAERRLSRSELPRPSCQMAYDVSRIVVFMPPPPSLPDPMVLTRSSKGRPKLSKSSVPSRRSKPVPSRRLSSGGLSIRAVIGPPFFVFGRTWLSLLRTDARFYARNLRLHTFSGAYRSTLYWT